LVVRPAREAIELSTIGPPDLDASFVRTSEDCSKPGADIAARNGDAEKSIASVEGGAYRIGAREEPVGHGRAGDITRSVRRA
jgi:hypothetical protein